MNRFHAYVAMKNLPQNIGEEAALPIPLTPPAACPW